MREKLLEWEMVEQRRRERAPGCKRPLERARTRPANPGDAVGLGDAGESRHKAASAGFKGPAGGFIVRAPRGERQAVGSNDEALLGGSVGVGALRLAVMASACLALVQEALDPGL